MYRSEKTPWAFLLFASVILLAACTSGRYSTVAKPVEGVITHYETGEPIPDAFVVARWTGTSGGLGHSGGAICFHVEVTKTDGSGRYYIPVPEIRPEYANYRKPRILITAYKPGYREPYWVNDVPAPSDTLIETNETSNARLSYLHDVVRNTNCDQAGDGRNNLLPLYEVLYVDAVQASESREDKEYSFYFLSKLEALTLGGKEASDNYYERMRNHK